MFRFITVAALLATAAAEGLRPQKQGQRKAIVGGTDANNRYPWFVQFDNNRCGGTLFDHQHVLTSASCVTPNAPRVVWINADTRDGDDGEAYEYEVECAIRHPDYSEDDRKNDIAVIKLKRRCASELVDLANSGDDLTDTDVIAGNIWYEIGLGDTSEKNSGSYPQSLQEAEMLLITDDDCLAFYGDKDLELTHHVCVNSTNTRGYCAGDGGTPLLDDNKDNGKQYGVATPPHNSTCLGGTNEGETGQYKCGDPDYPDVYADVAYFHDWIVAQVDVSSDKCDSKVPVLGGGGLESGFVGKALNLLNAFLP